MPSQLDLVVAKCETLVAQAQIAANQAAAAAASIGTAGLAPLQSPAFTGTPTAPTPPFGDISDRISTTAWSAARAGVPNGIATLDSSGLIPLAQLPFAGLVVQGTWSAATNNPHLNSGSGTNGFFYVVTVSGSTTLDSVSSWAVGDWALFGGGHWTKVPAVVPTITNLPLSSLEAIANNTLVANISGGSTTPAAIAINSITSKLSTFVGDSGAGGSVGLVPAPTIGMGGTAGYFLNASGNFTQIPAVNLSAYALLNSPAFTGTPTAPTIARGTNSTALATAQFVISQLASATEMVPVVNGTASCGTSTYGARIDHIHPTDLSRAPVASPTFNNLATVNGSMSITGALTVSGTVTFNNAALSVISLAASSFITAQSGTISQGLTVSGTLSASNGTLTHLTLNGASTLGGSTTAATQSLGNNSTLVATTAFVLANAPTVTAGSGIVVAGSTVSINTNNAGGIGAYSIIITPPNTAIGAGATFTSDGSSYKFSYFLNGQLTDVAAVPNGQVWRNMGGNIPSNSNTLIAGLFMRIS